MLYCLFLTKDFCTVNTFSNKLLHLYLFLQRSSQLSKRYFYLSPPGYSLINFERTKKTAVEQEHTSQLENYLSALKKPTMVVG